MIIIVTARVFFLFLYDMENNITFFSKLIFSYQFSASYLQNETCKIFQVCMNLNVSKKMFFILILTFLFFTSTKYLSSQIQGEILFVSASSYNHTQHSLSQDFCGIWGNFHPFLKTPYRVCYETQNMGLAAIQQNKCTVSVVHSEQFFK